MTAAKIPGWWVDERVPELGDALPASVPAVGFGEWLGPRLGRYRSEMEARAALGPLADDHKALARAHRVAGETLDALGNLPPRVRAILQSNSLRDAEKLGTSWGELTRRLSVDLLLAGVLLSGARIPHAKRGRKGTTPRDKLLAAIASRLREGGVGASAAQAAAAEILVRCRIASPADPDRIKRAICRGR